MTPWNGYEPLLGAFTAGSVRSRTTTSKCSVRVSFAGTVNGPWNWSCWPFALMSGSAAGVLTPVAVAVSVALQGTYVKPEYSLSTNWTTPTSPAVSLITACEYPFGEHCATG